MGLLKAGGEFPRRSRGGHELMYQAGDSIIVVSYTVKGDTFVPEKPRVWLAKPCGTEWDSAEAPKQEHELVCLQNFADELQRKVPVGK